MQHMKWQDLQHFERSHKSRALFELFWLFIVMLIHMFRGRVHAHEWASVFTYRPEQDQVSFCSTCCLIALQQALSLKSKSAVSARLARQWAFRIHLSQTPSTRLQTSMVMPRSLCEHQDSTSNCQTPVLVQRVLLSPEPYPRPLVFSFLIFI